MRPRPGTSTLIPESIRDDTEVRLRLEKQTEQ